MPSGEILLKAFLHYVIRYYIGEVTQPTLARSCQPILADRFGAMKVAQRKENVGKVIVCILADTGQRYLSVEGLFD